MRAAPSSSPTAAEGPYRLPRTVEPVAYRIALTPDLEAAAFEGTVEVDVRVHEETDEIVLNAADLEVGGATVAPRAAGPIVATVVEDPEAQRITLRLPGPLAKGDATVRITFAGTLNDKLRGFYRSTFTDGEGATHLIATTQMESTDARRAFPCWDEPDRKATFEVALVVDDGLAAYSNSPVTAERTFTDAGGRPKREVRFAPTMKMSTYLVAFVVGPLEATEPLDVGGVPVRVVHAPGKGRLTGYALDVARHALEFFTAYFGIAYPGEKLDLVAIPDFAFGAMENLGCVTFRESLLLADPAAASRVELERIADVVHHEIAHMWFGDLVTMGWWEGIWLNEAFATFMEILGTDDYRPQWQRWVTFGLDRDRALSVDGLHSTRPIEYPVGSPEDAEGMFDVLTYEKGGSVLRMLEQFLGPQTFRDGVRRYLEAHAYANTVTADLWYALEQVSKEPVRAMADSWILQGGHPLVRVHGASASQEPFSYLPPEGDSAIGSRWLVPLLVRVAGDDEVQRSLLTEETAEVAGLRAGGGPAVVNAGGWGVYRVAYPPAHLESLARSLPKLRPLERFDLFSDAWALVLSARLELGELLSMAAHLSEEDEPGIFSVVAGALSLCDRAARGQERPQVQAAARVLLQPRAATLGWDRVSGEGERVPTLRALVLDALGRTGADEAVRAEAARRFGAAISGGPAIDPDLESAVLAIVADQLRDGDYEAMLDRYHHPATPQQELRYLTALAAFPDVAVALRTYDLARSPEVRTQDAPYLVGALLANRVGGPAVWERVEADWDALLAPFPQNSHARMLSGVRWLCADPELAERVQRFLTAHPLHSGQRTVVQSLEQLRVHVRFVEHLREGRRLSESLARLGGQ